MPTDPEQKTYNQSYYERNKADILRKRKLKYRKDKEYRERLRESARDSYARRQEEDGKDVYQFGTPVRGSSIVQRDGQFYYSAAYAAKRAGVSQQTIRRWEKEGVIPEPMKEEGGRRWRWFTPYQVVLLKRLKNYYRMTRKEKTAAALYVRQRWEIDYADEIEKRDQKKYKEATGEGEVPGIDDNRIADILGADNGETGGN